MLKKLRRFIIKKTLEKKLLKELKALNLLEELENATLILDEETCAHVSFDLKTDKNLFKKIYFYDIVKDKMTVEVIFGNTGQNLETMVFSVTNFLDLHPQMYTIAIKNENRCTIVQEIDLNSGKITCSMCIGETYRDQLGLAVVLLREMEDVATKLFKQEIAELTISVPDFEEKTYLFEFTFSKIVYTPKTSINLKYFDSLKKYF